ncbi:Hypothetical predicted protein [Cloeon dipterum]|uniref:CDK5RAP1-like protein n=1 Tax=Cloeon dipterum TaxID=197152 RepID=A0A8S1BXF9_9INSE|nr:Hypothetical predicted protein [Cloeon dipterum]
MSISMRVLRCMPSVVLRRNACRRSLSSSTSLWHKVDIKNGPGLQHFIANSVSPSTQQEIDTSEVDIPYIDNVSGDGQKVYFDVYGCQMNVNDTEVVWSILQAKGYEKTDEVLLADVILVVTCAIREGAETKVWNQLRNYRGLKKKRNRDKPPLRIGVLGCMAERLKEQLIEKERSVDIVAGPDSYRDLPRLLALSRDRHTAVNVMLSHDETYADVMPVRLDQNSKTAYVTIMRGCDNMCTYCIVPFTRGRERSRPISSIVDEIRYLSQQGIKEVTLLGQNVNSYRDLSEQQHFVAADTNLAKGFKTVYKSKKGGRRFADLLDRVASIDPEMRIRFTSPHPKDFPDEVLEVIRERANVCKHLHLPAQSGCSSVLERMRRGYTREAYIDLVQHIREMVPRVSICSDFICGFCGESEEDFKETITLMRTVVYNWMFIFMYSLREKTTAHRRLKDDVPDEEKRRRIEIMHQTLRMITEQTNKTQLGTRQLILVEGASKRSRQVLAGRNEANIKVNFPAGLLPMSPDSQERRPVEPGDYVVVEVGFLSLLYLILF